MPPPSASDRQLVLPIPGVLDEAEAAARIPRADRVFVNRNLRMSSIEWVGFDMDYTLAIYRQDAMDALSVELTVERLIRRGYPRYLRRLAYDTRFPIRGLLIDKRFGHVLKMDRHKVVLKGYHGQQRLSREQLLELYHHKRIRPHTPRYHWIDTLFALSEVTAFAAIVAALEHNKEQVDYGKLFGDVRAAIDEAHRDGSVYAQVTADLARFVDRDAALARTLHKLRSAGKRLFLLTNSPWGYSDQMLRFLLGDAMPEYPSWQNYFDIVVCSAQKPAWFHNGRPFMERDDSVLRQVKTLERGRLYEGGNLRDFERLTGVLGSSVLYVGDHIYGDILRSKKESSWRTLFILQELDAELRAQDACLTEMTRVRELYEIRDKLEDELRFYQARFKDLSRQSNGAGALDVGADRVRVKKAIERIRSEMRRADHEHAGLIERVDDAFHPYWGSLLKEEHEMSSFGLQVNLYADIYARRVSCLGSYSPTQFFRSPHDLMPHEI
ncbi:MAG: HAD-IG family 5'-nucleotidase [Polyangiaceae bacterium]